MSTHTPEELNALYRQTGEVMAQINEIEGWRGKVEGSDDGITWAPFKSYSGTKKFLRLAPTPKDPAKAERKATNEEVLAEWDALGSPIGRLEFRDITDTSPEWMQSIGPRPESPNLEYRLRSEPTKEEKEKTERIASNESVRQEWEASGRKRVVECRNADRPNAIWLETIGEPTWSEKFEYRLRPEPVYVPWDDGDLVAGRVVKRKRDQFRRLVGKQCDGIYIFDLGQFTYVDLLRDFVECVVENGQIVERPCGKREEAK